jgi:hypothetical protein
MRRILLFLLRQFFWCLMCSSVVGVLGYDGARAQGQTFPPSSGGGSGITALTGDVTATGPGSATSAIMSIDGGVVAAAQACASTASINWACLTGAGGFTGQVPYPILFTSTHASGANQTLNVDGQGASPIRQAGNQSAIAVNDIRANAQYLLIYDGTNWELQTPPAASGGGTVTSVTCGSFGASWLTCNFGSTTTTPSLVLSATVGQTSHQVIGTCGSATSFAPCPLVVGDLPATVVTSAASLGSGAVMTGSGSQGSQTPDASNFQYVTSTAAPTAPTLSTHGTAGSTTHGYCAALRLVNVNGPNSACSTTATTTTSAATVNGTNYDIVTAPACASAPSGTTADIYLVTAGGNLTTLGWEANVACGAALNVQGNVAYPGTLAPTSDLSKGLYSTNLAPGAVIHQGPIIAAGGIGEMLLLQPVDPKNGPLSLFANCVYDGGWVDDCGVGLGSNASGELSTMPRLLLMNCEAVYSTTNNNGQTECYNEVSNPTSISGFQYRPSGYVATWSVTSGAITGLSNLSNYLNADATVFESKDASTVFASFSSYGLQMFNPGGTTGIIYQDGSGNTHMSNANTGTGSLMIDGSGGGAMNAGTYNTNTNCSSSASPAICVRAAAGSVAIPTGVTNVTLTVNTTAVTANSQIFLLSDDSLGTKLGVTCNSTLATLVGGMAVTARTAATSFTVTYNGTIATNPLCVSYFIVN